jgi:hypothetical protein
MEELKAFVGFFFDRYMARGPVVAKLHPLNALKSIAVSAPKKALTGLRMATNDCVEAASPWTPAQVREADAALRAQNIVTLSELRRRFSRQFAAVLKRGKIANEPEYYLVQSVLSDATAPPDRATLLSRLVAEYEARHA